MNLTENFKAYIRDFNIKLPKNNQTTQATATRNTSQPNEDIDDGTNDSFYSTQTTKSNQGDDNQEEEEHGEEEEAEDDE